MTKIITVIYLSLILVLHGQDWYAQWDQSGATWHEKWKNTLDAIGNHPSTEQIEVLGAAVRVGPRIDSPEHMEIFKRSQSVLLEIPGHATYFVDKLERERAALKSGEYRGYYHSHRQEYIDETLVHLPSPETIRVLGNYLYDERDNPPPPVPGHFNDADPIPSSTRLAYQSIMAIGLRNPPVTKEDYWKSDHRNEFALTRSRAWFEKVKSGELAFSFVGQKVEYRFKPDGTWETIALVNPPDDAPRPARLEPVVPTPAVKSVPPPNSLWPWIVGVIVVVAGGLLWWRCGRSSLRS